jgi:hypothetical protein
MICRSIAFETDDVAARPVRMDDADIDPLLGHADLWMRDIPGRLETREEPPLEVAVRFLPSLPPVLDRTARGVFVLPIN